MSAALQKNIARHGFKARWELELATIDANANLVSEEKTVEGMPDVKWHLQWNYSNTDRTYRLYLNFESENEVIYETHLHYFTQPDDTTAIRQTGTSTGTKKIELQAFVFTAFAGSLLNGKLIIAVDGYFSYINKPTASFFTQISPAASEWGLRLKLSPKDFDFVVDGKIIEIHKLLVASESPVFARMFESNFEEAKESKATITDYSFETVQSAIDYCYRQDISPYLEDVNNAINLLYFSDKYDFQTLKPILESHLSSAKFLTKENISILASTADKANALQLRQACIKFMCSLLNKNQGFNAEEIAAFDPKFKDDVLLQALI
uniref:BTB domain-containing protein n=1 Tax=Panagrolaimus sp. ES5 TaxID=591445 RepID=A0AC34G6Q5_9BILA